MTSNLNRLVDGLVGPRKTRTSSKRRTAPKPKPRRNRKRNAQRRRKPKFALSDCAQRYCKALEDPFSGITACVPTITNFPTLKHSFRTRGTFKTGDSTGFVTINPYAMMFSDLVGGVYTSNTYTGNTIQASGTGVNAIYGAGTPYDSTDSAGDVKLRLVAAGLRVRNVTAITARGGVLAMSETINHSASIGYTYNTLLAQDTAESLDATLGSWSSVTWHPQDEDEFDFIAGSQAAAAPYGNTVLSAIAEDAVSAASQTYEWEVFIVCEAKGNMVHGLSLSHSDPQGLAAVQTASGSVANRKPTQNNTASKAVSLLMRAAEIGWNVYQAYSAPTKTVARIASGAAGPIIEEVL